jgi:uncharacterized protein
MGDMSNEPTMEEILSSIKKIIAEDGEKSLAAPRPRRTVPREPSYDELGSAVSVMASAPRNDEDDVLELTDMADYDSPDVGTPSVRTPPVQPQPAAATAAPPPAQAAAPAEIVSPTTVAASRSALDSLSSLVIKPEVTGTDTLEGMVREMIRPMLKDWLDARLPELVEAMVAREIARISGR